MSLEALRAGIEAKFQSDFAIKHPTIPVKFDNVKFSEPTGAAWVAFMLIPGDRYRTNIGSKRCTRQEGIFNIACMVPEETGNKLLFEMVDSVYAILDDLSLSLSDGSRVSIFNGDTRNRGVIEGWQTANVQIEFRQDS